MLADLGEAALLFLSKPRRGGFVFRRKKHRKERRDKGKLRVVRPGHGIIVDHTGLRRLLERDPV